MEPSLSPLGDRRISHLHREVGETFEWFNVDFEADPPLTKTGVRSKSAIPIADFAYRITGEVAYLF